MLRKITFGVAVFLCVQYCIATSRPLWADAVTSRPGVAVLISGWVTVTNSSCLDFNRWEVFSDADAPWSNFPLDVLGLPVPLSAYGPDGRLFAIVKVSNSHASNLTAYTQTATGFKVSYTRALNFSSVTDDTAPIFVDNQYVWVGLSNPLTATTATNHISGIYRYHVSNFSLHDLFSAIPYPNSAAQITDMVASNSLIYVSYEAGSTSVILVFNKTNGAHVANVSLPAYFSQGSPLQPAINSLVLTSVDGVNSVLLALAVNVTNSHASLLMIDPNTYKIYYTVSLSKWAGNNYIGSEAAMGVWRDEVYVFGYGILRFNLTDNTTLWLDPANDANINAPTWLWWCDLAQCPGYGDQECVYDPVSDTINPYVPIFVDCYEYGYQGELITYFGYDNENVDPVTIHPSVGETYLRHGVTDTNVQVTPASFFDAQLNPSETLAYGYQPSPSPLSLTQQSRDVTIVIPVYNGDTPSSSQLSPIASNVSSLLGITQSRIVAGWDYVSKCNNNYDIILGISSIGSTRDALTAMQCFLQLKQSLETNPQPITSIVGGSLGTLTVFPAGALAQVQPVNYAPCWTTETHLRAGVAVVQSGWVAIVNASCLSFDFYEAVANARAPYNVWPIDGLGFLSPLTAYGPDGRLYAVEVSKSGGAPNITAYIQTSNGFIRNFTRPMPFTTFVASNVPLFVDADYIWVVLSNPLTASSQTNHMTGIYRVNATTFETVGLFAAIPSPNSAATITDMVASASKIYVSYQDHSVNGIMVIDRITGAQIANVSLSPNFAAGYDVLYPAGVLSLSLTSVDNVNLVLLALAQDVSYLNGSLLFIDPNTFNVYYTASLKNWVPGGYNIAQAAMSVWRDEVFIVGSGIVRFNLTDNTTLLTDMESASEADAHPTWLWWCDLNICPGGCYTQSGNKQAVCIETGEAISYDPAPCQYQQGDTGYSYVPSFVDCYEYGNQGQLLTYFGYNNNNSAVVTVDPQIADSYINFGVTDKTATVTPSSLFSSSHQYLAVGEHHYAFYTVSHSVVTWCLATGPVGATCVDSYTGPICPQNVTVSIPVTGGTAPTSANLATLAEAMAARIGFSVDRMVVGWAVYDKRRSSSYDLIVRISSVVTNVVGGSLGSPSFTPSGPTIQVIPTTGTTGVIVTTGTTGAGTTGAAGTTGSVVETTGGSGNRFGSITANATQDQQVSSSSLNLASFAFCISIIIALIFVL